MFENVWSGERQDVLGRSWELTLDFDQDTGLFRRGASREGAEVAYDTCADPVDAGLMEGPGAPGLPDDPEEMPPLIPAETAEMTSLFSGRFSPFGTPDDIVSGTWLSPADWPEARKAAASGASELSGRCNRLYRLNLKDAMNEDSAKSLTLIQISQHLNAMYGGPNRWPRKSVDALFAQGGPFSSNKSVYRDPNFAGDRLPPVFMDAVARTGSTLAGRELGYRGAARAIVDRANRGLERWETVDSFVIVPVVDAARFVGQVKANGRATVTMDLSARFGFPVTDPIDLGTVEHTYIQPMGNIIRRQIYRAERFGEGSFDPGSLGVIDLPELRAYLDATDHGEIFSKPEGIPLDFAGLGYGLDADGPSDRVLLSVFRSNVLTQNRPPQKDIPWWELGDQDVSEWTVTSWSKSDGLYHMETYRTWDLPRTGDVPVRMRDDAVTSIDRFELYGRYCSQDPRKTPIGMANARYAADPECLLSGRRFEKPAARVTPGTRALKENLEKLNVGAGAKRPAIHSKPKPGYFTY